MFTFNLRKSWRKAFGPWVMAASPHSQSRLGFRPRLEVLEDRLVPANLWYVAGLGDLGEGYQNPNGGGQGDLRFCMMKAAGGDTIYFGVSGTIALNSQLPAITQQNLTIDGAGQNVEIWGGGGYRIFDVNPGVSAEIDNLSIDNGDVSGYGGGLLNSGSLTLKNDTFVGNQAINGGGGGGGGAIGNDLGATLIMKNCSLNNNATNDYGGGILNYGHLICSSGSIVQNKANLGPAMNDSGGGIANIGGSVDLEGMEITGNKASLYGGGIYENGGTVSISVGTRKSGPIQGNSATYGGGIYVLSGSMSITGNIPLSQNTASSGGGIFLGGGGLDISDGSKSNNSVTDSGGGVYIAGGKMWLYDEKVAGNTAQSNGGGLYLAGGSGSFSGGTFTNNQAGKNGGGLYNLKGVLTLKDDVQVLSNTAKTQGGGLYLADGSNTGFNDCLVKDNKATTGKGVYQQYDATVDTAGLTDDDDPGGEPVKGP